MKDLGIDIKEYNPKAIKNRISGAKNELMAPDKYETFATTDFEEKVVSVYRRYQERLKAEKETFEDNIKQKDVAIKSLHLFNFVY